MRRRKEIERGRSISNGEEVTTGKNASLSEGKEKIRKRE